MLRAPGVIDEAADRAWRVAAGVFDPLAPSRRTADPGILRDLTVDDRGRVHVQIVAFGSPQGAMEAIRSRLIEELTIAGFWHVDVEFLRAC